jgi:hypothetical protein
MNYFPFIDLTKPAQVIIVPVGCLACSCIYLAARAGQQAMNLLEMLKLDELEKAEKSQADNVCIIGVLKWIIHI